MRHRIACARTQKFRGEQVDLVDKVRRLSGPGRKRRYRARILLQPPPRERRATELVRAKPETDFFSVLKD